MSEKVTNLASTANNSCENPHGLMIHASFIAPTSRPELFRSRYQRNNKKGGQKNLRCFPDCRNGVHIETGFCGDSVNVHVVMSRVTTSGGVMICPFLASNVGIVTYARFHPVGPATQSDAVLGPSIEPGQVVNKAQFMRYVRGKGEDNRLPYMAGTFKGAASEEPLQSAVFEFNDASKAWHYGWAAPRRQGHGGEVQHVFQVLFFKVVDNNFYCLEFIESRPFSIFSSRRASGTAIKEEKKRTRDQEDSIKAEDGDGIKAEGGVDLIDEFLSGRLLKMPNVEASLAAPSSENTEKIFNSAWRTTLEEYDTSALTPAFLEGSTPHTSPAASNSYSLSRARTTTTARIIPQEKLPWLEMYDFLNETSSELLLDDGMSLSNMTGLSLDNEDHSILEMQ